MSKMLYYQVKIGEWQKKLLLMMTMNKGALGNEYDKQ